MKLLISIILAGLIGLLVFAGPIGIYIIGAIIVGVFFRSFILLSEIHKQIVPSSGADKAAEAYERYLKELKEKDL